jgi:hypothetical protein
MYTHPLILLLQGDTTLATVSTTSNVEQLHRHYNQAPGSGKTIMGLVVSSSPDKLVISPTTVSSDICKKLP